MIDFSFLHEGDYITVDSKLELDSILAELEEFGICWSGGRKATQFPEYDRLKKRVRYVRFHESGFRFKPGYILYGVGDPEWNYPIYKASKLLQLSYSDSTDSDFEPLSESDLRGYLSV